jgi:hypothetical protein
VRGAPPIAIISFNRPHFLAQLVDSLQAQTALNGRPVFLFQDNAVSPFSGIRYAADEDIAACVAIFRARFPDSRVFLAPHNLGIARNILRAEEFLFAELGTEIAYFLEDDMVLSPHYLTMMDRISAWVERTDRVGYFSAYGALTMPLERQRQEASTMRRLAYHWAFGLTRRHWSELREWLEPYYRLCNGRDYSARQHLEILSHYQSMGMPLIGASQDVVKKLGTYALGRVALNTMACFGKSIGVVGLHFDQTKFERGGFTRTELYPEPVELNFPSPEQLDKIHRRAMEIRWRNFRAHAANANAPIKKEVAEEPS